MYIKLNVGILLAAQIIKNLTNKVFTKIGQMVVAGSVD